MDFSCKYCSGICIKKGIRNGCQKLLCKGCNKHQQASYSNNAYQIDLDLWIFRYVKEGLGIRSISRILKISTNTVLSRISTMANQIPRPSILKGKTYEVDELRTYIKFKRNLYWVISAYCRETKEIVAFKVGKRNNKNLKVVIDSLLLSNAVKIYTDRLRNYISLIPRELHNVKKYSINHLERWHLTMRTRLKRLNRKTICYSKSLVLLYNHVKLLIWGEEKFFEYRLLSFWDDAT